MGDTWHLSAVASLVEELDKKLLVVLRDGSKILGTLRSFDQFANIVLENAVERVIVGQSYSDIPLGLCIVRGENVVLMGEVDEVRETEAHRGGQRRDQAREGGGEGGGEAQGRNAEADGLSIRLISKRKVRTVHVRFSEKSIKMPPGRSGSPHTSPTFLFFPLPGVLT